MSDTYKDIETRASFLFDQRINASKFWNKNVSPIKTGIQNEPFLLQLKDTFIAGYVQGVIDVSDS